MILSTGSDVHYYCESVWFCSNPVFIVFNIASRTVTRITGYCVDFVEARNVQLHLQNCKSHQLILEF